MNHVQVHDSNGLQNWQEILHDARLIISKKSSETGKSPWDNRDLE